MKSKKKDVQILLNKVDKLKKENKIDLSSDEDLSIGIMNLIAIEEHLFHTSQKTGKQNYLNLLNEVRSIRTELLKEIIKDYEGEVWCISKHLLAASMRIMEVGTKELKKGNKKKAWNYFEKSYSLYSLFWGLNLDLIDNKKNSTQKKSSNKQNDSLFSKLNTVVQKAIDCCKE